MFAYHLATVNSYLFNLLPIQKQAMKIAVNNLHLKAYKNQVTVLLGRNGAGKTTTMSILTGLFPLTSGKATINGFDVVDDIGKIRASLGICPQYSVLFDRLTVEENIILFATLKVYNLN